MAQLAKQSGYVHHFNIATQNIRSHRDFLHNICAQLIVRYGLDHAMLPQDAADNGAFLSTGGVWTNASSRELKDNIESLSAEDASAALKQLNPVRYVYSNSRDEEYVGFIAEDVPALVATNDRKSLSPMDIVAVLTTVTKDQKAEIADQKVEIAALRDSLEQQVAISEKQEDRMLQMEMTLAEVLRHQTGEVQVSQSN